jgi:hypothetical protein
MLPAQAGNIVEAVVWECGPSQRHLIAGRALAYALQRHLGPGAQVSGCAGLLDAAMLHQRAQPDRLPAARRCAVPTHLEVVSYKTRHPCCRR